MMTAPAAPHGKTFEAPHPGSQAMPRGDTGELIDAPIFTSRTLSLRGFDAAGMLRDIRHRVRGNRHARDRSVRALDISLLLDVPEAS